MKGITYLSLTAMLILCTPLIGNDASPPCYKQIHLTFFNDTNLGQALSLYGVNQPLWRLIASDLRSAVSQVPQIIQAEANKKRPNPLQPPFNANEAYALLQNALYSVFRSVMIANQNKISNANINEGTIRGAFQYIWMQQQGEIVQCLQSSHRR